MSLFKVVMVIQDSNPLLDWVAPKLAENGVELAVRISWSREELARWAADADLVWAYGGRHGLLEGEALRDLKRCRAILRTGSGTDNVDIATATTLGIMVVNTPQATAEPVSDHAIGLLFTLTRQTARHDRLVRRGVWDPRQAFPLRLLRDATLGLVGFGRVPRLMVRKLSGFGTRFLAHDPYVAPAEIEAAGAASVGLDDLFARSDFVSLHCPLNAVTRHLVDERLLRLMQPHAVLINTSRGQVVDEAALVRALREGWIAGAALDVLEVEPAQPDKPLLQMENVVLAPHLAGYDATFPQAFLEASVEAILDVKAGRRPHSVVNPQVLAAKTG